ncbi:MAG: hypothetical protein C0478_12520 [Planctomyces sp.]|nr:hypothetical protein [Planctomyces sp.]
MAIGQINIGRTPNSLLYGRAANDIQTGTNLISKLQQQINSQQKYSLLSENPTATRQTTALQSLLERVQGVRSQHTFNQGYLSAADNALGTVNESLIKAKGLLQSGIGSTTTPEEKVGLANEVAALIQSALSAANTQYQDRFLFSGTATGTSPFERIGDTVAYHGNDGAVQAFADINLLVPTTISGVQAFGGISSSPVTALQPAIKLSTPLAALKQGRGVSLSSIDITVDNGTPIEKTIDLSGAQTLGDLKLRIEQAFASEAETVTVDIDPLNPGGLRITPSNGTIAVANTGSGTAATQLRIASGPVASVAGGSLEPAVTLQTSVASLNGGTGIGATAGTGLRIVNGDKTSIVDLDGAVTVQDVLQRIRAADPNLSAEIDPAGRGIRVGTRLSGANFSIGENGGANATALGLRTFTTSTTLSELNLGKGVVFTPGSPISITRRDGTTTNVDLSSATTIQNVLDLFNAADPGVLTASLNATGNGISLADSSGAGPLTVASSESAIALGIDGTENTGAAGVLAGKDVNPQRTNGVFDLLISLEQALRSNDTAELSRLSPLLDKASGQVTITRTQIGTRQQLMDEVGGRLDDQNLLTKEMLSNIFDTDLTEAATQLLQLKQVYEATLQLTAQTLQMSILQYL